MVVGFALSERMTADIVVSALECARARGYVAKGAVFHSDYAEENIKPQNPTISSKSLDFAA
jgi:hypothetical protein